MYKAIIFDFFGVICTDIYWDWLYRNIPDIQSRKDEFQNISNLLDRGEIDTGQFFNILSERTSIPSERIRENIGTHTIINWGTVELIKEFKEKYKIAVLSNSDSTWLHEVIKDNGLKELFDVIIVSSEVKFIKPQKEIFDITLERLKASPQEVIFIDDRQEHVDAANSIGIHGILFTNPENLKKKLLSLDI